jgi:hypothetical protein
MEIINMNSAREWTVDVAPKQQTLSWFIRSGQVSITITNNSNCQALFRLEGADEAGNCSFEFQVPGETVRLARQVELPVQPGETVVVPVQITPLSRQLVSLVKQTHFCTITTTLPGGRPTRRALLTQLQSAPLIGPGTTAVITVCLVILIGLLLQWAASYYTTEVKMAQGDERQKVAPANFIKKATPIASTINMASKADAGEMTYEEIFKEIAQQYDLDWRLLAHIAYRESRLNPRAIGHANEIGLMQILPLTWSEWARKVEVTDPFDPYSNVSVAAAYLVYLRGYFGSMGYPGDHWMLVAYSWGPDNLRQLFKDGGGWAQVPAGKRQYALSILQAATTGAVNLPVQFQTSGRVPANFRKGDN